MCNTPHFTFFEDHEKHGVSTRDHMKILKKSPSPRILEQMNLLICLIAICSNLKYGYSFPFCRKALTLLNTGNGVFKESTVFEVRYTGIQGNEQKEPVLAAYYNSLHYFVTTEQCFRHTSKTNFWNSKIIIFPPKLSYTSNNLEIWCSI